MGIENLAREAFSESTSKWLIRWMAAGLLVLAASGAWAQLGDEPDAVVEAAKRGRASIIEYSIPYQNTPAAEVESCVSGAAVVAGKSGSTHEITFDHNGGNVLWIPGRTTTRWSSFRRMAA